MKGVIPTQRAPNTPSTRAGSRRKKDPSIMAAPRVERMLKKTIQEELSGLEKKPHHQKKFSRVRETVTSRSPRTQKWRRNRQNVQSFRTRDVAKSTIPAPMRKANPGAQKCETYRVKKASREPP